MDGDPSQAICSFWFLEYQQNTLGEKKKKTKPHHLSVFPYIWRAQKETKTSPLFFPFGFHRALCSMHLMHKTSSGIRSRCLPAQKALMWGKAQVPYKEMIFHFWVTHALSLGSSSKGKRPKHVLHINRSYIHGQSRVYELQVFYVSLTNQSIIGEHIYIFLN